MSRSKLRNLGVAGLATLSVAIACPPAQAQWVVFDPNNYAQNLLTAARSLQQINNQITSLQRQAQSLTNQARNLANLPYSSLQQLQQSIQRTETLLGQAQGVAFNVQQINQAYATTYAPATSSTSQQTLIANAQSRSKSRLQSSAISTPIAPRRRPWSPPARAPPARFRPHRPAISSSPFRPSSWPT